MSARVKTADGGRPLPSSPKAKSPSKPSWLVRIWLGVLTSLQESRQKEAARLIRRHRNLIADRNPIEVLRP